jgi:hypothetical protein
LVAQNQMRVDPNYDNFHYIPLLFLDDDCDKFLSRLDEIRFGEKCLLIRRITRTNSILPSYGKMLRENRRIIHGRRKNDRDIACAIHDSDVFGEQAHGCCQDARIR